jgi:hypothetical protein
MKSLTLHLMQPLRRLALSPDVPQARQFKLIQTPQEPLALLALSSEDMALVPPAQSFEDMALVPPAQSFEGMVLVPPAQSFEGMVLVLPAQSFEDMVPVPPVPSFKDMSTTQDGVLVQVPVLDSAIDIHPQVVCPHIPNRTGLRRSMPPRRIRSDLKPLPHPQ